jgi:hypothetical protein
MKNIITIISIRNENYIIIINFKSDFIKNKLSLLLIKLKEQKHTNQICF